jgi:hypothetical protein
MDANRLTALIAETEAAHQAHVQQASNEVVLMDQQLAQMKAERDRFQREARDESARLQGEIKAYQKMLAALQQEETQQQVRPEVEQTGAAPTEGEKMGP